MKKIVLSFAALFVVTSAVLLMGFTTAENETFKLRIEGSMLSASMDGSQETGIGDPDGTGWAELTLNSGQGTIEYTLHVENIDPAMAAHIHVGAAGVAGPVVVGLTAPTSGMSTGVAMVDKELIKAIRKNPSAYYVNVHNPAYPAGAVRGQLMK